MKKLIFASLLLLSFSSCKKTKPAICVQNKNEYLANYPTCKTDLFNKVQKDFGENVVLKYSDVTILNNTNGNTFYIYVYMSFYKVY